VALLNDELISECQVNSDRPAVSSKAQHPGLGRDLLKTAIRAKLEAHGFFALDRQQRKITHISV
jgi:hypothetical protein